MMAMVNRLPARLPKNETTQFFPTSMTETRRCKKAVHMNIMLLVKRSAPLSTIMTRPVGCQRGDVWSRMCIGKDTDRKEDSANSADEARCILLIPRRGIRADKDCATKAQQRTSHERVPEELVQSHVCLFSSLCSVSALILNQDL